MTVSVEYIKEQLNSLKESRRWANRREIGFLPKIVEEGENIHALTVTLSNEKKWLLALTNQRIVLIHRMMFDAEKDEISLEIISNFKINNGLFFSKIDLDLFNGSKRTFDSIMKKDAKKIAGLLDSAI